MKTVAIIGGGLAGTFLAAELVERGARVLLFDAPKADSATRVAAGMFNVVTGRKLTPTWLAGPLLAALHGFFARPAYVSLRRYFHLMPLYRRFASAAERAQFVEHAFAYVQDEGGVCVPNVGRLEAGAFAAALTALLEGRGLTLFREYVHPEQIDFAARTLRLTGEVLPWDALVFCEGADMRQDLFRPVRPLKGQLLHVALPGFSIAHLLVGPEGFVAPAEGRFIVGATYEHHFADASPTPEGRAALLTALDQLCAPPAVEVVQHLAGLRPTTPDRRPMAGPHPTLAEVFVFNGLGAKGVLQAPYFAALLAGHILTGVDLPAEVRPGRWG